MTPRKYKAQLDVHEDVTRKMYGGKSTKMNNPTTAMIDQIKGW